MSPSFRQERTSSEPGLAASKGSAGAGVVVHSSSSNEGVEVKLGSWGVMSAVCKWAIWGKMMQLDLKRGLSIWMFILFECFLLKE